MARAEIEPLIGSKWVGRGELWLDRLGNEAHVYDCSAAIERDAFTYRWSREGKQHEGSIALDADGATFRDSFHSESAVRCAPVAGAWGLFAVHFTFAVGDGPPWGWRVQLSRRPSGELVLQMTNVLPWGEETRAVRMIFARA
ncbi:MAG TPA: hypothetical protein VHB21_26115 [Minicystis sp.]|nr:hypothetical protein [Minicystis sp.]